MNSGLGGPAGFGETLFSSTTKAAGGNDDGSIQIDVTPVFVGSGLNFLGTNYTEIYVNSNGVITFEGPNTLPNLSSLASLSEPAIAAFITDINIEDGGENYVDVDSSSGKVTITWDSVAPFSGSGANSFQVVLTDTGDGNFDIEYIFEDIQYFGSGGGAATVGITDGGDNEFELEGSGNSSALSGYETNDFDNGDPTGTLSASFIDGTSSIFFHTVSGAGSDDVIDASGGNDRLYGGTGNDRMQIGFDKASGLSENITITLDADIDSASFDFNFLFTSSFGEE